MNPETMTRVKELFFLALEKSPDERRSLIEGLRAEDPTTARLLRALLTAHEEQGLLDDDASQHAATLVDCIERLDCDRKPLLVGDNAGRQKVLGDYVFLEEIASGGIGVVYRARQNSLNRIVAVKVLRAGRLASGKEVERFRAEAEAVARLDHPNIVPVYEVGQLEDQHYFTMKVINGPSLASRIDRFRQDHRAAVSILATVAHAVHHAHQRGILHRDLKPSNILLDEEETPYVADFGIAKRLDKGEDLTQTGGICGTPAYMAPEQITYKGEITVKSDVYSLGCILFELLAGRPPFEGRTLSELLKNVLERDPPRLRSLDPHVPRDLEIICMKCLAKEPARRYPSAHDLAGDLERWLTHQPILARPVSTRERLWLLWRRKPLVTSLVAAVALLLAVLAVGASASSLLLQQHLTRALDAEEDAHRRLRNSLMAQARANRRSNLPGRRHASLDLLAQAALLQDGGDLRDEAIACMALTDLRVAREWLSAGKERTISVFDPANYRFMTGFQGGRIEIRAGPDHIERELSGFGPEPWKARFSPDGRYLAVKYYYESQPEDAVLRVWDVATGRTVLSSDTAISGRSMDFDPSGSRIAYVTEEGRLILRDLPSGTETLRIQLESPAMMIRFRPDGDAIAIAQGDSGWVEIRDSDRGGIIQRLHHGAHASAVDWSSDGRLLVAGYYDFLAYLWDVDKGIKINAFRGHQAEVVETFFLPGAEIVATYSWDETTRFWDSQTGELMLIAPVQALGYSTDGQRFAFGTGRTEGYWDVLHGDVFRTLYGHKGKSPKFLAVHPDSRLLASAGEDGIFLWDLELGQQVIRFPGAFVRDIRFEPQGDALLSCGPNGVVRWQIPEEWSSGDGIVPTRLTENACWALDVDRREEVMGVLDQEGIKLKFLGKPERHIAVGSGLGLSHLTISPGGRWVSGETWRGDGIRVWDGWTGEPAIDLLKDWSAVGVLFGPDGEWMVTGNSREYHLWRTGSWDEVRRIARPVTFSNLPGMMTFDSQGNLLAIALTQRIVQILDFETAEVVATLEAPVPQSLTQLRFSPDQRRLIAATATNRIQIWELNRIDEKLQGLNLHGSMERFLPSAGAHQALSP